MRRVAGVVCIGVILAVLQGCRGKPRKAEKPAAVAASASVSMPDANTGEALPADVVVNGPVWQFVEAWGAAIDRHDVKALEGMYAERVSFYGQRRSKAEVIAAKQSAFAAEPDFHLQIPGFIEITHGVRDYYVAKFNKLSGKLGNLRGTDAKLVIGRSNDGPLLIREEADSGTSDMQNSDCSEVAAAVVNALPEVKHDLATADARANASKGALRVGGIGPMDLDDPDGFSVMLGLNSDEQFETVVSYEVNREGLLSLSDVTYGAPVAIPPSALRKIAKTCRR